MEEKTNIYELNILEKNLGLTPADSLILEIQKPKMPTLIKYQNEIQMKTKKSIVNNQRPSQYLKYKDPKVSCNINYFSNQLIKLNRKYALY